MFCDFKIAGFILGTPFLTLLCPVFVFIEEMTFFTFIEPINLLHIPKSDISKYDHCDEGSDLPFEK